MSNLYCIVTNCGAEAWVVLRGNSLCHKHFIEETT